ncbi:hypothetical protein fh0823_15930 [Francisella halioticida]|nr:hypothetical protein fh0823_15930 [Francisella halioticida]
MVSSGSSITNSGSTAKYNGVDERNNLKMFKVAILPFDAHNAKINASMGIKQLQDGLNNIIIAQITQSRKFREYLIVMLKIKKHTREKFSK